MKQITKFLDGYTPLLKLIVCAIDDDALTLRSYKEKFKEVGICNYELYQKPTAFLDELNDEKQIIVIDNQLNDAITGLELLVRVKELQPLCKPIFVSAVEDIDVVVEITRSEAVFIRKKGNYIDELVYEIDKAARSWDKKLRNSLQFLRLINEAHEVTKNYSEALGHYLEAVEQPLEK